MSEVGDGEGARSWSSWSDQACEALDVPISMDVFRSADVRFGHVREVGEVSYAVADCGVEPRCVQLAAPNPWMKLAEGAQAVAFAMLIVFLWK